MIPIVYNFVHTLQDDDPGTIYNLAKFAFMVCNCMFDVLRFDFQDYVQELMCIVRTVVVNSGNYTFTGNISTVQITHVLLYVIVKL